MHHRLLVVLILGISNKFKHILCQKHIISTLLQMLCFRLNDVFNDKREDASQFMITVKHTGLVGNVIYIILISKVFINFYLGQESTIFNNTAKKSTS